MLRRKLLILHGTLVALLLTVAVLATWQLQGVLKDLDHTNTVDGQIAVDASRMGVLISLSENELREIQLGREQHLDDLIDLAGDKSMALEILNLPQTMAASGLVHNLTSDL